MLHVGVILGERVVTCRHDSDSGGKIWKFWGKDVTCRHDSGGKSVTCRHDSGERYVTCRHDSGGKICYM